MWQAVLDAIDRIESWLVLLPMPVQIPLLLVVLVPLAWLLARAIDPLVEWVLRLLSRRPPVPAAEAATLPAAEVAPTAARGARPLPARDDAPGET